MEKERELDKNMKNVIVVDNIELVPCKEPKIGEIVCMFEQPAARGTVVKTLPNRKVMVQLDNILEVFTANQLAYDYEEGAIA